MPSDTHNEPLRMQQCPKWSLLKSLSLPRVKWPYLAHFVSILIIFGSNEPSNDRALSQMVLHEITQPPVRKMAVSSPFLY